MEWRNNGDVVVYVDGVKLHILRQADWNPDNVVEEMRLVVDLSLNVPKFGTIRQSAPRGLLHAGSLHAGGSMEARSMMRLRKPMECLASSPLCRGCEAFLQRQFHSLALDYLFTLNVYYYFYMIACTIAYQSNRRA